MEVRMTPLARSRPRWRNQLSLQGGGPVQATLAIAMMLAGCAVGPNFKRPSTSTIAYSTPPPSIGPQSVVYGGDVAGDWYRLFQSQSLNTLVQEALRANPDLEGARHNLLAAQ